MSPGKVSKRIVLDRVSWIDKMAVEIQSLPLSGFESFIGESKNIWAAESCLRRMLEALFDIGRHLLSKAFAVGVSEYKEIAIELKRNGVLTSEESELLVTMAGYRNRLVHFYVEVTEKELYQICKDRIADPVKIRDAFVRWLSKNPNLVNESL